MAKQIQVTRVFNSPVEMVWRVWSEAALIMRWWGPKDFTAPSAKLDFREGGKSIVSMKAPPEMGGQLYYSLWVYVKILPLSMIEFIQSLSDEAGNKINPTTVGMPSDFPKDIRTIVNFKQTSKSQTEMTVTEYAEFGTISNFAQIGLEQSIEKMAKILNDNDPY